MKETKAMVQEILEGKSPREVISAAVNESLDAGVTDEAATVTKKVVRNGKVVKKKFKKYKKRRILTAAQKRAIKKAQAASKKSSAKTKRTKSLRKAATLEGAGDEMALDIRCPDCPEENLVLLANDDYEAPMLYCPACDKTYALVDIEALSDLFPGEDEDDDEEDLSVDIIDDDEFDDEGDESDEGDLEEGISTEDTCDVCGKPKKNCVCGDGNGSDDDTLYFEED